MQGPRFYWLKEMEEDSRVSRTKQSSKSTYQSFLSLEKPREPQVESYCLRPQNFLNINDIQYPQNSYRGSSYMCNEEYQIPIKNEPSYFERSDCNCRQRSIQFIQPEDKKIQFAKCDCANGDQCHGAHCSCFLTPREICMIGQCCPKCIESKNNFLMATRGWAQQKEKAQPVEPEPQQGILALIRQKNIKNLHYYKQVYSHDPAMQKLTFCTCKRSHCQKKYCLCFEKGVKCGRYCICIECFNGERGCNEDEEEKRWERYATYKPQQQEHRQIDNDIDQFIEHGIQGNGSFNLVMEFEPPNFEGIYQYID